jgi:P-type Cu2+ transporter
VRASGAFFVPEWNKGCNFAAAFLPNKTTVMKQTIPVIGMACASCAANVERRLRSLEGVTDATVSLPLRTVQVDYDPTKTSLEVMKREVNAIGYDLVIEAERSADEVERRGYRRLCRRMALSWALAVAVMAVSMRWIDVGGASQTNQLSLLIALVSMSVCGGGFYRQAWRQLTHATASMDTLVALSTLVAFLFSAYNTFWGDRSWGSRGLEWHTYFDSTVMIIAFVLTGRVLEERAKGATASSIRRLMSVADTPVDVGDILEVLPGETIPADGEVVEADSFMTAGAAYVDESMVSGEPIPVQKRQGMTVLAGTKPCQGRLKIRARQTGEGTVLAQITRMVREAQASKAPLQRVADRAAGVFVPVIGVLSLVTFTLWIVFAGMTHLPQAVMSAVAVLVIACPCAMGLATPTAVMVGMGKAAGRHILIKDAAALEKLRSVNALVIDKTGTLTIPNKDVDFTKADSLDFEQRETLKPNAREAIARLCRLGIEVHLMSGDKETAVRYWAEKTGIENYHSEALPQDKEDLVRTLQKNGNTVAMVGDGVNDVQALALADVGIAIGKGVDVALDTAQMTVMGDDLMALPEAVRICRQTVRVIWQNLFWAFIYNMVCIPLAAGLLYAFGIEWQVSPTLASALMAMSSVSVVLNSLRLRYMR